MDGSRARRTGNVRVELFVDPCCPFAWIAYQWLTEVRRQHREIDLSLQLMSLPMLNEHQDISPEYRRLLDLTWGPARVAAAAVELKGPDALPSLYEAIGRRLFDGGDHYRVIREQLDAVIKSALWEVGLPPQLADAATTGTHDGLLRTSHDAAMATVGGGVGTPIVQLDGAAFFGPVMTGIPSGAEALRVFDGLRMLAASPRLVEVKRPLIGGLEFRSSQPPSTRPAGTGQDTRRSTIAPVGGGRHGS